MLKRTFITLAAAGLALAMAGEAAAAEHRVQMLNRGDGGTMVFSPAVVRARPGDTIRYVPTDPGHNAETIAGMLPAGVQVTRGAMGREYVLRVTQPGVYGVKCAPHYSMGMVGLVIVGDGSANRAAAQTVAGRAPNLARRRFTEYFAR
ncbi:pseudoazurin [Brevundimonas viscosa]|uniref:Pseudoazurin n=1 Tax=Brevundimonas viscosa TaxID=871741 RepID=A0A1I6T3M8_9CAUL|nr:pseudoazurin [Brevundimonas viscosa]SFS83660.1 pseudoazurin [Brevundimonas viscosa]